MGGWDGFGVVMDDGGVFELVGGWVFVALGDGGEIGAMVLQVLPDSLH